MNRENRRNQGLFDTTFLGVSAPARGCVEPDRPLAAQKMPLAAVPRPISAPKQGILLRYACVGLDDPGLSRGCPMGAGAKAHNLGDPGPQGPIPAPGGPVDVPEAVLGLPGAAGGPRASAEALPDALAALASKRRVEQAVLGYLAGRRAGCRRANNAPAAPESAPPSARSGRFPGESGHGSYPRTPRTAPAAPPAGRGRPAAAGVTEAAAEAAGLPLSLDCPTVAAAGAAVVDVAGAEAGRARPVEAASLPQGCYGPAGAGAGAVDVGPAGAAAAGAEAGVALPLLPVAAPGRLDVAPLGCRSPAASLPLPGQDRGRGRTGATAARKKTIAPKPDPPSPPKAPGGP